MASVVGPEAAWTAWSGDPLVVGPLLIAGWAYYAGVGRLWRRAGRGQVVRVWQARAFGAGLAAAAAALLSPLEGLSGTLLTAHMAQHLVLVLAAGPLIAAGGPLLPLLWALPDRLRDAAARYRTPAAVRRRLRSPAAVAAACVAHVGVMWAWHLPAVYEAALRSEALHAVEHAAMLGSALLVWLAIVSAGGPIRRAAPIAALAMFGIATLTVGLAALIALAPAPLYATYAAGTSAWGIEAVEDQQIAGALMWAASGLVYTGAGAGLLAAWLFAAQRDDQKAVVSRRAER